MKEPVQMSLFNQPTLNIADDFKEAMALAVKNSGLSREQVVEKMNGLAARYGIRLAKGNGKNLNISTLEKWLNLNSPGRMISVKALNVFCAVVGDNTPIDIMVRPLGAKVIGEKDIKKLAWADASLKAKKARRKIRELEAEL